MLGSVDRRARAAELRRTITHLLVRGIAVMVCTGLAALIFDMLRSRTGSSVSAGLLRVVNVALFVSFVVAFLMTVSAGICFLVYLFRYGSLGAQGAQPLQSSDAGAMAGKEPEVAGGSEEEREL